MTVRVLGPKDTRGPSAIDVTTRSKTWSRALSPMLLGPVDLYGEIRSVNTENAWQYSKVYKEHTNANGDPTGAYWEWAEKGWSKSWADRYPMGKGAIPLYSLWDGQKLDYIEARKEIYIPLYIDAVLQTHAWGRLHKAYKDQGSITLFDYDGYDYLKLGMTLTDVVNDPSRKMGHAFVLAIMLTTID